MADTDIQKKNIQVVQTALANAFAERFDVLEPLIADDFTIYEAAGLPFGGIFRGIRGYVDCMKGIDRFFTNKTLAPPEFVAAGDKKVLMLSTLDADIAKNGQHVQMPTISVWEFKDGKISTVRPFFFDTKRVADLAAIQN